MNPFSPLTYILRDHKRSIVAAIVLSLVTVCFLAGMYINNPEDVYRITHHGPDRFCFVKPRSGNAEVMDNYDSFTQNVDSYKTDNINTVIFAGEMSIAYTSIMSFENGTNSFVFASKKDFDLFNSRVHVIKKDVDLNEGEVVISRDLANNIGAKKGDKVDRDHDHLYGLRDSVIVEIVDEPGIFAYAVGNVSMNPCTLFVKGENVSDEAADKDIKAIIKKVADENPNLSSASLEKYLNTFHEEMGFMIYILYLIVAIVGVVLAVTINSLFSVIYDRRKYEFSIYKALGFKKGRIFLKIAGEVLTINTAALILGSILCAIVILAVNYIMAPKGNGFCSFSTQGLIATIICDLMVVFPVILINWRRVKRYDVTEN